MTYEERDTALPGDHRNMFAHLRKEAMGKYLNLLQEEDVFEPEELLDAFKEYLKNVRTLKLAEKMEPDDVDEWYRSAESPFKFLFEE